MLNLALAAVEWEFANFRFSSSVTKMRLRLNNGAKFIFGATDVEAELPNSHHFDHSQKISYIQMWFNVTKDLLALEFKDQNE